MLTLKDIDNLAYLARLDISVEEKEILLKDLESILAYVSEIKTINVDDNGDDEQVLRNVLREDRNPMPSGTYTEKILREAPDTKDGYIKVKQVF